jgi:hypothetical protein
MICKTKIEKAWLAASVFALFGYHLFGGGTHYEESGLVLLIEFVMILLSAPLGVVVMLPIALAVDACDQCSELSWMLDWSIVLFFGYLQWFVLIPEIRKRNELTLLKLDIRRAQPRAAKQTAKPALVAKPAHVAAKTLRPAARTSQTTATVAGATSINVAVASPRTVKPVRAVVQEDTQTNERDTPPSPHFDEPGLTPL